MFSVAQARLDGLRVVHKYKSSRTNRVAVLSAEEPTSTPALRIADTVDPQTRTVKVRAEMDNSRGRLRPEINQPLGHGDRDSPIRWRAGTAIRSSSATVSMWKYAA